MGRRRLKNADTSLFPFLSVLCSLIGVFTLFLVLILGSKQLDARHAADQSSGAANSPETLGGEDTQQLQDRLQALEEVLNKRRIQRNELMQRIMLLQELIAEKTEELKGAQSVVARAQLGKPEDVEMTLARADVNAKKPRFVEIQADGFVFHPERIFCELQQLKDPNSKLLGFLSQMDSVRQREYLLFLIHPDGVPAYNEMRAFMHKNYAGDNGLTRIDLGWEPFSPGWVLLSQQQAGK